MENIVKIISIENVTHNVKRFRIEKPKGFVFEPGQATDLSVNEPKWKNEKRPFTFTCLRSDPYLEFTIKIYADHDGVTKRLGELSVGDELIIGDVWGAITYKGEGYFIAGGAGITPFIAILRKLFNDDNIGDNKLFFSNVTEGDIILHNELATMLGNNAEFVISGNNHKRIDREFLKTRIKDFSKHFYICGPDEMVKDITNELEKLGAKADAVVFEQ